MSEFFVTFGQKYRQIGHPTDRRAHPDGWFVIVADDLASAQTAAHHWLGTDYAFLYDAEAFGPDMHYYPLGELARRDARKTAGRT